MKNTLAFHIAVLYRDFLSYTTGELKNMGLSFGQMPLIVYVGKHPGCTQAELTRSLKLDWGYSQRSIGKLAEGSFLKKEYDDEKAGNCLTLTELGLRAFDVSHKVFGAWDDLKTERLTLEEQKMLIGLLDKITAEETEC